MADFAELLKTRRSIRDFEEKQVPTDIITEIIKESTLAPSSGHGQPWRFIIVNNRDWIKKLSDESKANIIKGIEENPDSPSKRYEGALRNKDFNVFYNAPALVIIVGPKNIRSVYVDCSLAACYFMLAASAKSLGTCWINLGAEIRDPEIRKEIGLTDDLAIVAPIIIGHPRKIPNPPPRNEPQILKVIT